jgi:hypothetical protein
MNNSAQINAIAGINGRDSCWPDVENVPEKELESEATQWRQKKRQQQF